LLLFLANGQVPELPQPFPDPPPALELLSRDAAPAPLTAQSVAGPFAQPAINNFPAPLPSSPSGHLIGNAPAMVPVGDYRPATPSLSVQRFGPTTVKAGQTFSYEIIVRNVGGPWAGQARLEEQLPPGTKWIAANPAPLVTGDRLAWTVENIAAGAEQRFKVEAQASQAGEWKAEATLTASVAVIHRATVEGGVSPVHSIIVAGPESVPVGRPMVFSIRVANTTSSTLPAAVLRVRLSQGLQHLKGSSIEGNLGDLAPGQSKEMILEVVTVQTGQCYVDATLMSNQQIVAAGRGGVLAVEQTALGLKQTGPLSPPLGSENDYKIEVSNRSAAEMLDVLVEDVLPAGFQYVHGDSGARFDPGKRAVSWNLASLAPGQSKLLVFRAQAQSPGTHYNRITAKSAGGAETLLATIVRIGERR
jgi:uncharacterized repeat protein (TIGR01451 family)